MKKKKGKTIPGVDLSSIKKKKRPRKKISRKTPTKIENTRPHVTLGDEGRQVFNK